MSISLPLDKMSIEEKLQAMEALWDDLSKRADAIQPPEWHGEVLAERKGAIVRGDETFEEWEAAREQIEKDIR